MANSFDLARDEHGTVHAYRNVLTLCGEWVDAGRWSSPAWMRSAYPGEVNCDLCHRVLDREAASAPTNH